MENKTKFLNDNFDIELTKATKTTSFWFVVNSFETLQLLCCHFLYTQGMINN